ncbi:MAG: RagB/SusD family nutrient uptake outer membrane protein [Chitinophagaceae bacterium]|nr:RagB/SusD family nutrient uptake outer membrane protein [Chitinophagaceae bacterium]
MITRYKAVCVKCWWLFFVLFALSSSCKKFLDEKPDKKLVIPSKLEELQSLMDNYDFKMNYFDAPAGEVSSDNYYLLDADYQSLAEGYRRMYTWEKDNIFTPFPNDWSYLYDVVYVANTVLDHAEKVSYLNEAEKNNVKGQAFFFRARSFFQATVLWSVTYDETTAKKEAGIVLRLNPDFNKFSARATVEESYNRIVEDLKSAIPLLPLRPVTVLRPSRTAAYGLLARVYLSMAKYDLAGLYADSSLQLNSTLMNYNSLNGAATFAFPEFNTEVIFKSRMIVPAPINPSRAKIDSVLYRSYDNNDLRKTLFFKSNNNGSFAFRGSYEGATALFSGIASDEMFLTRAECYARAGNYSAAMNDLNTLLKTRWKTGTFVSLTAVNAPDALNKILSERRKELAMRGLRWMDIKRLNREGAGIILKRVINGVTLQLDPGDLRYALALPEDLVTVSGLQQNPR